MMKLARQALGAARATVPVIVSDCAGASAGEWGPAPPWWFIRTWEPFPPSHTTTGATSAIVHRIGP
jgi:hypothetical protein